MPRLPQSSRVFLLPQIGRNELEYESFNRRKKKKKRPGLDEIVSAEKLTAVLQSLSIPMQQTLDSVDERIQTLETSSGGAPADAQYLLLALDSEGVLTNARRADLDDLDFLKTDGGARQDYDVSIKRLRYGGYMQADHIAATANSSLPNPFLTISVTNASSAQIADVTNHTGITRLTSTNAAGRMVVTAESSGYPVYYLGSARYIWEVFFRINQLSDGTNTFVFRLGLGTATTVAESTNRTHIGLAYTHSVNSGKWVGVTRSTLGTSDTGTVNGGVTVAAATWYRATLDFNTAASRCDITVTDGTNTDTIAITTDIPTFTNGAYFFVGAYNTAGTGSRTWDWDASDLRWILPAPR